MYKLTKKSPPIIGGLYCIVAIITALRKAVYSL